ncbi:MAG: SUMF1/EgtB/PvdO family nonheme iron enzyme [Methylobacteriaceae bacterium]|nr:SUMF1/EgtB/PvdO family nonheme iron enzyme [Methylobacteriaceae bacterium]
MSRIFVSHSSHDNAATVALRDWLVAEGWSDLFLDLDPERGIAPGERWERALNEAARRCEAVIFVISRAWLSSRWCLNELTLARRLNKRMFGVLIEEGLPIADLPADVVNHWQMVDLAAGSDHRQFRAVLPISGGEAHVTFSREGLARLKAGLLRAGLHAAYFAWPPVNDPKRAPYRGLRPLEADDAGIFFGREAPVIDAIDGLRGLAEAAPPRLMAILGASGAGKSSFLRAGLLPRLGRDARIFLPLPAIRPERSVISGETGLVNAIFAAFEANGVVIARGEVRDAVTDGAHEVKALLRRLRAAANVATADGGPRPPTVVIAVDQAEELFLSEAQDEARPFLRLLAALLASDDPAVVVLLTIRSDNYERLQSAPEFDGLHQETLSLPPMPKGAYADVVKGPLQRLADTPRAIRMEERLIEALLADVEAGGAKDALPLLAFTLERLYQEYGASGQLTLAHYEKLGGVIGSIEAGVERALMAADNDPAIPRDRHTRLTLMRRGLIPWLAGIDPDTKAPRRRVARASEIPIDARPLVDLLVEQRLLSTDVAKDTGETTIEPAHEALLRQWPLLQDWLNDDAIQLTLLDGVKRAAREWGANGRTPTWLTHGAERLRAVERVLERPDLAASLDADDLRYVAACRLEERRERWRGARVWMLGGVMAVAAVAAVAYKDEILALWRAYTVVRPYRAANFDPFVLSAEKESRLTTGDTLRECRVDCPEMIIIPAGRFSMGSPPGEADRYDNESPRHEVVLPRRLAVARTAVTNDQWNACVTMGVCRAVEAEGADAGGKPVVNVSWDDARTYASWLSGMTGRNYRLLSEAEWEYAARAGSSTAYYWGDDVGEGHAVCDGCGTEWDSLGAARVARLKPNAFGLYDMAGNAYQWVADCSHDTYVGAPTNGAVWTENGDCKKRMARGGSWADNAGFARAAARMTLDADVESRVVGFRVARDLSAEVIR